MAKVQTKGAVAAGNPHTSEAAEAVLRAGGNAVDGAVAASLAAFVCEPLLASAGGSGILTCLNAQGAAVVDFFSSMPTVPAGDRDFAAVDVDFGSAVQRFHVGRASVAAPKALPGLAVANARFGRMPLREVAAPAIALAKSGPVVTPESADVFSLLWPINLLGAKSAYTDGDGPPAPGTQRPMPGLATLLEAFVEEGTTPRHFLAGMLEHFGPKAGGCLGEEDFAEGPKVVEPARHRLKDVELFGSPRLGGRLLALISDALASGARLGPLAASPDEWARIADACRRGSRAKEDLPGFGSTTHISVADRYGGAASVTLTNGEGCGHLVPGTDTQLNNFLGEEDLHPGGFFRHAPGTPLPSMIAPTLAAGEGTLLALGSGGANRIRSVVAQVLWRATCLGASLRDAVLAPRVHAEEAAVWFEAPGMDVAPIRARLREDFDAVFPFPERAFFFGGVHAVMVGPQGADAFADPRRGGEARIL